MENYDRVKQAKEKFKAKTGFTPEQMGTPIAYEWHNSVIFAPSKRALWALLEEWRLNKVLLSLASAMFVVCLIGGIVTVICAFYSWKVAAVTAAVTGVGLGTLGSVFYAFIKKRRRCQNIHKNQFFFA